MLGLNYIYPSLNPAQIAARRTALDDGGLQAYLLPIIILTTFYIHRTYLSASTLPTQAKASNHVPTIVEAWKRRIYWVLTTTTVADFGTADVVLVMLGYFCILVCIIFRGTGDDYMHLTKALSHVTVSQLPLHYLLSIKSLQSPITKVTGLTHERLNNYHRLLGRMIHALLAAHAAMYLKFFIDLDILTKRLKDRDVRTGVLAFWTVNFLGLLSIPPIRKFLYHKVFYRSHVVLSALLLVVVWFHVPYTRVYTAQAAIFWILNGILRRRNSIEVELIGEDLGEDLLKLTMTSDKIKSNDNTPGMHIYLNAKSGFGPRTPFTVLDTKSLGNRELEVTLIAKNSGGPQTSMLANAAKTSTEIAMQLEGPYGEARLYIPHLLSGGLKGRRVLIVCGGVGATYGLSIWRALLQAQDLATMRFIWIVRTVSEARWAETSIRETIGKETSTTSDIEIYVTRDTGKASYLENLRPQVRLINDRSRPDLSQVVASFFAEDDDAQTYDQGLDKVENRKWSFEPVTVFCCGPGNMTRALKHAVGKHIWGYGRDIEFYEEAFGFGGG